MCSVLTSYLPDEILDNIWKFVHYTVKMRLNKKLFIKYHPLFVNSLDWKSYQSLVRLTLRNRMKMVFDSIYSISNYWKSKKKYIYGGHVYTNYFSYVYKHTMIHNFNFAKEVMSNVKDGNSKEYRNRKRMKHRLHGET